MARVYSELHGLPTVCLRYFTVYGPRMRPNMAISNFVSRCVNGEPLVIYGDGQQTRDFTYVADVVDANRTLLESEAADGDVVNIGSSDNISIQALAETVRDQLAPELEIKYESAREADAEHTHASVEKAGNIDQIRSGPLYGVLNQSGIKRLFRIWPRANTQSANAIDELLSWLASLSVFVQTYNISVEPIDEDLIDIANQVVGPSTAQIYQIVREIVRK